jgi:hypothetical protein
VAAPPVAATGSLRCRDDRRRRSTLEERRDRVRDVGALLERPDQWPEAGFATVRNVGHRRSWIDTMLARNEVQAAECDERVALVGEVEREPGERVPE